MCLRSITTKIIFQYFLSIKTIKNTIGKTYRIFLRKEKSVQIY